MSAESFEGEEVRHPVLTIIMKWASITVLLLAGLWPFSGNSELVFEIVLCAGVIPVVLGSIRAGRPQWAVGFIAIALVFNLIGPVGLSQAMILWVDLTCVAALIVSLAVLKRQPALLDVIHNRSEVGKLASVVVDRLREIPVH